MANQDTSSRQLNDLGQQAEANQIQSWIVSLDNLIAAVDKSPIDDDRKNELLLHIAAIRNELASGNWPQVGTASAMQTLAHEVGEFEQAAQDWQVLSMQLAQWVKAISDSLGVK